MSRSLSHPFLHQNCGLLKLDTSAPGTLKARAISNSEVSGFAQAFQGALEALGTQCGEKNAECQTLMFFQQDVRYDLIESSFRGSVHGSRGVYKFTKNIIAELFGSTIIWILPHTVV